MKKSENTEGNMGIQMMMAIRAEARIQNFFWIERRQENPHINRFPMK